MAAVARERVPWIRDVERTIQPMKPSPLINSTLVVTGRHWSWVLGTAGDHWGQFFWRGFGGEKTDGGHGGLDGEEKKKKLKNKK